MPWRDPLGLRQHTDFFQGHSASPLIIWAGLSIDQSVFPDKLKKAQVTPLYKKNDPLLKTNYRPVSVLCIFSKIFEKILEQQLKILVIWGAIIDLLHFIILAGIPSAPVAFFMLILFIIFSTLSVVTFSKTNWGNKIGRLLENY
jgi:hypothetical protein